jgi:hypothetical protein
MSGQDAEDSSDVEMMNSIDPQNSILFMRQGNKEVSLGPTRYDSN